MTGYGRRLFGKIALMAISFLFVLGGLEIVLRVFGDPPPPPEENLRTYTEYDEQLGWRGRSGAKGPYTTSRFSIQVALNSGGWRDDEPLIPTAMPAARPEPSASGLRSTSNENRTSPGVTPETGHAEGVRHSPRRDPTSALEDRRGRSVSEIVGTVGATTRQIALLGDSFAWGYGVDRTKSFGERLEASLPGWRVQNYGICGYGTDQELLVLRQSAIKIRPAIVIVEFAVANDIENILAAKAYRLPKPRFVLDGDRLKLEGVPVPRTDNWQRAARTGARDFMTAHVRLYAWARPRWAALKPRLGRLLRLAREDMSSGVRIGLFAREGPEKVRQGWKLAEAILEAMRDEAAKAGARLVILIVPDRFQVEDSLWDHAVKELRLDPSAYDRELPDRALAEIGQRLGVLIVDPLPVQRAHASEGQSLFIPDDPHWNEEGHRLAAEELSRALRPLLDSENPENEGRTGTISEQDSSPAPATPGHEAISAHRIR